MGKKEKWVETQKMALKMYSKDDAKLIGDAIDDIADYVDKYDLWEKYLFEGYRPIANIALFVYILIEGAVACPLKDVEAFMNFVTEIGKDCYEEVMRDSRYECLDKDVRGTLTLESISKVAIEILENDGEKVGNYFKICFLDPVCITNYDGNKI